VLATPAAKSGALPTLLCRQDAILMAVPIAHVRETMRPLPIEPVPGMPNFVLGVSVVRGAPVPVVDSAILLGLASGRCAGRWVVLRAGARRVVLSVEAIEGIRDLTPEMMGPLPPLLRDAGAEVIAQLGTLDADLLVLLRAGRLLSESDWSTVETIGRV
jgi:purine-binding chemotaxis protein CheW